MSGGALATTIRLEPGRVYRGRSTQAGTLGWAEARLRASKWFADVRDLAPYADATGLPFRGKFTGPPGTDSADLAADGIVELEAEGGMGRGWLVALAVLGFVAFGARR